MQKAQIQWIQIQLGFLILSLRESTWEFMISMDLDGFSHGFSQFNDAESVCVFLSFPSGFWHWKWVVVYWKYHGLCGSTGPYQQWKPWTAEAGGRSSNIDRAGPLESGFVFEIWGTSGTPNPVLIDIMFIKLDVFFLVNLTSSDKLNLLANKWWISSNFLSVWYGECREYMKPLDFWGTTFSHG